MFRDVNVPRRMLVDPLPLGPRFLGSVPSGVGLPLTGWRVLVASDQLGWSGAVCDRNHW